MRALPLGLAVALLPALVRAQPGATPEPSAAAAMESEVAEFEARGEAYFRTLGHVAGRDAAARAAEHRDRFLREVAAATRAVEAATRRRAVAVFRDFVAAHPDDPSFTPDALMRLADLFADEPPAEVAGLPDRRCAILPAREVVERFPAYRHRDLALYLLGYELGESGELAEAQSAWRALVCPARFAYVPRVDLADAPCPELVALARSHAAALVTPLPAPAPAPPSDPRAYDGCAASPEADGRPSHLAAEVWFRLGEAHFDASPAEPALALAAYAAAMRASEPAHGTIWSLALYKSAWTRFRMDDYAGAVRDFGRFLDAPEPTDPGAVSHRTDALQWLAIALAEPVWGRGFARDAVACRPVVEAAARPLHLATGALACAGVARVAARLPQDRPWTPDAYLALAQVYFQQTRYPEAIAVDGLFLRRFPGHARADEAARRTRESLRRAGVPAVGAAP